MTDFLNPSNMYVNFTLRNKQRLSQLITTVFAWHVPTYIRILLRKVYTPNPVAINFSVRSYNN